MNFTSGLDCSIQREEDNTSNYSFPETESILENKRLDKLKELAKPKLVNRHQKDQSFSKRFETSHRKIVSIQQQSFMETQYEDEDLSDLGIHEDIGDYDDDIFEQPVPLLKKNSVVSQNHDIHEQTRKILDKASEYNAVSRPNDRVKSQIDILREARRNNKNPVSPKFRPQSSSFQLPEKREQVKSSNYKTTNFNLKSKKLSTTEKYNSNIINKDQPKSKISQKQNLKTQAQEQEELKLHQQITFQSSGFKSPKKIDYGNTRNRKLNNTSLLLKPHGFKTQTSVLSVPPRVLRGTASANSVNSLDMLVLNQGISDASIPQAIRLGNTGGRQATDKSVINVHQHFNQPNIMNFNHKDYYDNLSNNAKTRNQELLENSHSFGDGKASAIQKGADAINLNRRRIVSSILPRGGLKTPKSNFYTQLEPFVRASSTQNLQSHLLRRQEKGASESLIRNLKSAHPGRYSKKKQSIERLSALIRNKRFRNASGNQLHSTEGHNYADTGMHLTHFGDSNSQGTFTSLHRMREASAMNSNQALGDLISMVSDNTGPRPGTKIEPQFSPRRVRHLKERKQKRTGRQPDSEKADLQSQLYLLKTQLNLFTNDNTQLRTQNATKEEKLKEKQKLIDELVQITEDQDQMISGNFTALTNETANYQKARLIQQISDLKEKLGVKTKEFNKLQRDVKTTKIQELQQETQVYQQECLKLRSIAEQAISILNSHGLLSKLKSHSQLKQFVRQVRADNLINPGHDRVQDYVSPMFTSQVFPLTQQSPATSEPRGQHRVPETDSQLQILRLKLTHAEHGLKEANDKLKIYKVLEIQWQKDKNHMSSLIKQASSLQDQFQQKLGQQEQELEAWSRSGVHTPVSQLSPRSNQTTGRGKAPVPTSTQATQTVPEKSIMALEKQISQLEEQNSQLHAEMAKATKEMQESQLQIIAQNREYIELQNLYKVSQAEKRGHNQDEYDELTAQHKKLLEQHESTIEGNKNLRGNLERTVQKLNDQLDECQGMNNHLFEEINSLKEKMIAKGIRGADLERLSESQRGKPKPARNTLSPPGRRQASGQRLDPAGLRPPRAAGAAIKRENTERRRGPIGGPVAIIEEKDEEEGDIGGRTGSARNSPSGDSFDSSGGIGLIQQDLRARNQRKRKSGLSHVMRSNSYINLPPQNDMLQQEQTYYAPDGLLAQLDQIQSNVDQSEADYLSQLKSQATQLLDMKTVIQRDDPTIQLALSRVGRLQQIKRLNLDRIEDELFGEKYKLHRQVKLVDLSHVFITKLGLTQQQSLTFSRFLVEDADDGPVVDNRIAFNPKQKINYPEISVRLQAYSVYPFIYRNSEEQEARDKLAKAVAGKEAELSNLFDDIHRLYQVRDLHNSLNKVNSSHGLTDPVIDCLFVMLCRRVPFELIDTLTERELIESYQGFRAESLHALNGEGRLPLDPGFFVEAGQLDEEDRGILCIPSTGSQPATPHMGGDAQIKVAELSPGCSLPPPSQPGSHETGRDFSFNVKMYVSKEKEPVTSMLMQQQPAPHSAKNTKPRISKDLLENFRDSQVSASSRAVPLVLPEYSDDRSETDWDQQESRESPGRLQPGYNQFRHQHTIRTRQSEDTLKRKRGDNSAILSLLGSPTPVIDDLESPQVVNERKKSDNYSSLISPLTKSFETDIHQKVLSPKLLEEQIQFVECTSLTERAENMVFGIQETTSPLHLVRSTEPYQNYFEEEKELEVVNPLMGMLASALGAKKQQSRQVTAEFESPMEEIQKSLVKKNKTNPLIQIQGDFSSDKKQESLLQTEYKSNSGNSKGGHQGQNDGMDFTIYQPTAGVSEYLSSAQNLRSPDMSQSIKEADPMQEELSDGCEESTVNMQLSETKGLRNKFKLFEETKIKELNSSYPFSGSDTMQSGPFAIAKRKEDEYSSISQREDVQSLQPGGSNSRREEVQQTQISVSLWQEKRESMFDQSTLEALKNYLSTELRSKIDEQFMNSVSAKGIDKMLNASVEVIANFAVAFKEANRESLRVAFRPAIFQISKEINVEVIRHKDLGSMFQVCMGTPIDPSILEALNVIWQTAKFYGLVPFQDIEKSFEFLGIKEQIPTYHLQSFSDLDSQSIRVLNSLNEYLFLEILDIDKFLEGMIIVKKFKSKSDKPKAIACIDADAFSNHLYQSRVTTEIERNETLCTFLSFNSQLSSIIPIDKLKKVLKSVAESPYLVSFGSEVKMLDQSEIRRTFLSSPSESISPIKIEQESKGQESQDLSSESSESESSSSSSQNISVSNSSAQESQSSSEESDKDQDEKMSPIVLRKLSIDKRRGRTSPSDTFSQSN